MKKSTSTFTSVLTPYSCPESDSSLFVFFYFVVATAAADSNEVVF
jgi:hypothetical protein